MQMAQMCVSSGGSEARVGDAFEEAGRCISFLSLTFYFLSFVHVQMASRRIQREALDSFPLPLPLHECTVGVVVKIRGQDLIDIQIPSSFLLHSSQSGAPVPTPAPPSVPSSDANQTATTLGAAEPLTQVLAQLPSRYRHAVWLKRGSFIIFETFKEQHQDHSKILGEIKCVLFPKQIKYIQEQGLWPVAFQTQDVQSSKDDMDLPVYSSEYESSSDSENDALD